MDTLNSKGNRPGQSCTNVLFKILLFTSVLVFFYPPNGFSTMEYARQTGKNCGTCHIGPSGGGPLTKEGEGFKESLRTKGEYRVLSPAQRIIRLAVGYLHMMTAIIWFGTILYVHIILKPAYAAQGLPRGELMIGWASIIVLAVTGTLLTIARVPSLHMLFHTRFGILLLIKIGLFFMMVSTAIFVTFIVGPKLRRKLKQTLSPRTGDITSEELSQYAGKEGSPSYVAFNRTIYDVTHSIFWSKGIHFKKHSAGNDLTEMLKTAPHGEEKVLKMPVVGKLLAEREVRRPPHIKIFYFFAYMNLFLIFSIVFVISLWRWW